MDPFGSFSFGFGMFSVFFTIMFVVVISIFAITIFKMLKEWNQNNKSPRLTVHAKVIGKRTNIQRHRSGNTGMGHTTTTYYVSFEVESGDRMELRLPGTEYGLLIEGDEGNLSFQGTRFLSFDRI
ncbi:MAG: DUF2500 domain-containing protein [Clostridia bacterium]|nr:DUF2500 domain-containing protein [Clostridia bacterium]